MRLRIHPHLYLDISIPAAGWHLGKTAFFRKVFNISSSVEYPDGGSNTETFINDQFVELESLGALVQLELGEITSLTETWELYPRLYEPFLSNEICEIENLRGEFKK